MKLSDAFRWNARQFEAARFGLITALLAVGVATAGMELTWRAMSSETQSFIEQSIGDTATLLAGHVRSELDHVVRALREGGRQLSQENAGELDLDADWIQLMVWKKESAETRPEALRSWIAQRYRVPGLPEIESALKALETSSLALLESSYSGQLSVVAHTTVLDPKGLMWVAIPRSAPGAPIEIVTGFLTTARIQRIFRKDPLVSSILVDAHGMVLGHPDGRVRSAAGLPEFPLVQRLSDAASGSLPSLQMRYSDSQGSSFYGGFRRLQLGGLTLIASVPDSEARSGLHSIRVRSITFIILTLLVTFGLGYAYSISRSSSERREGVRRAGAVSGTEEPRPDSGLFSGVPPEAPPPEKARRVALYGTIRRMSRLAEQLPEQALIEAVNDAMTLVQSRVRDSGGVFEFHSGVAFNAVWEDPECAIRCALVLRQDFSQLNDARKVDGVKELHYGFALHETEVLAALVGPAGRRRDSLVGDVFEWARELEKAAAQSGHDLDVTRALRERVQGRFLLRPLGELSLAQNSAALEYFWVEGLVGENGEPIPVVTPYARVQPEEAATVTEVSDKVVLATGPRRWLINNGSQIVGPLDATVIASLLFAQELDFDSECWSEGTGISARIATAGIFEGSQEPGADHWVFDGTQMHGPFTSSFLMMAVSRGAVSGESYVCHSSTVTGWMSVAKWREGHFSARAAGQAQAPKVA